MRRWTYRHASGTYRYSSRRCGTVSPTASNALRISGSGAWVIVFASGCSSIFRLYPRPGLDIADDGLAALMDVNVFDCDFLLSLAPVLVEGFHGQRIGPGEFVGEAEVLLPPLIGSDP